MSKSKQSSAPRQSMVTRRQLVAVAATVGAAAISRGGAEAQLSQRSEWIIRNARVLTMDPTLGDLERGDVHVRNGAIVAVGTELAAPDAEAIDGRDMIALPGLIDTHDHLWNSTCRNLVQEGPQKGYFATVLALGRQYTPTDTYRGVRLGCAELLYSGVTTVHDWAHNIRGPEHADADVRALNDTGIRARFSYGTYQGGPAPDQTMDIADLERMQRDWGAYASEGRLTLGMASRSVSDSPRGAAGLAAVRRDWEAARALRLPITIHTGNGIVTVLEREGLLGPDVQLINSSAWSDAERVIAAGAGTHVSMSPFSEMRYSYALPQLVELLRLGLKVSLAVDTPPVAGTADLFAQMRVLMDTQFVRTKDPLSISTRQVLEMATINGAWDLGIAHLVGSLTPGKRADLILIRTTDLNMAPLGDPVTAVVRCAQPHNVDTVIVDGRNRARGGRFAGRAQATCKLGVMRQMHPRAKDCGIV
jgi:5-methylthioadenosine/S-adenosylhomocysteine deaminase